MYLDCKPVQVSLEDRDMGYVPEADSGSETEIEAEKVEPDGVRDVTYDKEDPPMRVGSKYPNIEEFKLALSQHAVKHEF
ncbi:uncharacterized protein C2845_PM06G18620 [Panicum miliaceum]|uniref:Uncharacterized protein n=1 Tax=Panicum miliaceum TaxID=4540 RepID=A0A3L6RAW3_PANMI|nr:uncharacterized protein C2845_PM06G18620 [Panicum miliaceum]